MISNKSKMDKTIDPAAQYLLEKAEKTNVDTAWNRYNSMKPRCSFGNAGLCCHICMTGPCRIDLSGTGPKKGICGITPDGMVARNLCRMIAAGTSAHADHTSHILEAFKNNSKIKDLRKLSKIAHNFGLRQDSAKIADMVGILETKAEEAFSGNRDDNWLHYLIPEARFNKLRSLKLVPKNINTALRETLHRTTMGVDADYENLLSGALQCALADFLAMDMASNLSDIILGTPRLSFSEANIGVLDPYAVNIAVHGHNPLITESILKAVPAYHEIAKQAGALHGINIVGVCCTGNEISTRHGIPLAANTASQELLILTGAVDAMIVDVQCIMPSLSDICDCFHTQLITTMPIAKIPGAKHIDFELNDSGVFADTILKIAIAAYKKRDQKKVDIPNMKETTLVGFSNESITDFLRELNTEDPLHPVVERIKTGDIAGIILFAGCNNYKVVQDSSFIHLAEKFSRANILMLATGCAAGTFARHGFLSPRMTEKVTGNRLKKFLVEMGNAAGINMPLPPVWHMGSCIDTTRAVRFVFSLANKMNIDTSELPFVVSAPEAMSEKAIAISLWALALGFTTHLGIMPPLSGGELVNKILLETIKDQIGARFIVESDPMQASTEIEQVLEQKRSCLGLPNLLAVV